MRYVFNVTILVDGVPYKAGQEADEGEIPAGCLVSLRRLGQVSPVVTLTSTDADGDVAKPKKK